MYIYTYKHIYIYVLNILHVFVCIKPYVHCQCGLVSMTGREALSWKAVAVSSSEKPPDFACYTELLNALCSIWMEIGEHNFSSRP